MAKNTLVISYIFSIFLLSFIASAQEVIDSPASPVTSAGERLQLKRTIAIARFSNETVSDTTFLVDKYKERLGKQASDILSARLASTERFLMFERIDSESLETEKILAGIEGSGVPVDYLIVGSVSEFGRSVESEKGIFSRIKTQKAYAKVNVRLVEVSTGRIVYSEEGAGESSVTTKTILGVGGSAGYDQSLTDRSISGAISQLVSSIVENLTKSPWKSYILAKDDGSYIIAGGASQGIRLGDVFNVYKRGRIVTNPQTGVNMQLPGKKIGMIKVDMLFGEDSFTETSTVSVVEGEIEDDFSQYYVSNE